MPDLFMQQYDLHLRLLLKPLMFLPLLEAQSLLSQGEFKRV
jgi:hypothetical protein